MFFPSSEGFVPDIWKLLGTGPWIVHPEKRSDVYVACSALSGVKLRSKKALEVKLRSERHESGAERWDKVSCIRLESVQVLSHTKGGVISYAAFIVRSFLFTCYCTLAPAAPVWLDTYG